MVLVIVIVVLIIIGRSGLLTSILSSIIQAGWGCLTIIVVGIIIAIVFGLSSC